MAVVPAMASAPLRRKNLRLVCMVYSPLSSDGAAAIHWQLRVLIGVETRVSRAGARRAIDLAFQGCSRLAFERSDLLGLGMAQAFARSSCIKRSRWRSRCKVSCGALLGGLLIATAPVD